jgi:hypothetical protein
MVCVPRETLNIEENWSNYFTCTHTTPYAILEPCTGNSFTSPRLCELSSVGIATDEGFFFLQIAQAGSGARQLTQWGTTGSFLRDKAAGAWSWPLTSI